LTENFVAEVREQFRNPDGGVRLPLESVAEELVKTAVWKGKVRAVVNFRVCEIATAQFPKTFFMDIRIDNEFYFLRMEVTI
jgi:hypothetical protein